MTPFSTDRPVYQMGVLYVEELQEEIGPWETTWKESSHSLVCRECGDVWAKLVVSTLYKGELIQEQFLTTPLYKCTSCGDGSLSVYLMTMRGMREWPVTQKLVLREFDLITKKELTNHD